MFPIGARHLLSFGNGTSTYSPIILNNEWASLWRFILIFVFATTGTIINGFFISSFFIERLLRRTGNVYLACVGLADLLITAGVMPAAGVVLISKIWELENVCYALQFLTQVSTYSYNLFFTMVAVETYVRLCHTRASYARFLSIPVGFVSVFIFVISVAVSGYGVYQGMDYDYCTRETYGDYTFRMITTLLLHGIPFTFTILFLVSSSLIVRARARRLAHYKRSKQYDRDYAFTNLNLACYALYVVAWIPYLIIVHQYPNTSDSNFYNCVWLGMSRSIVTSFLYSGLNGNFRRAYTNLFYYCCCKTSINERINNRHRTRAVDYLVSTGEVRVHIMHHSIATSPRRAGCSRDVARYTSEI